MSDNLLTLSRDELLTFLALIGSTTMNGLDDEPLGGLDDREIAERLNSGEHSLISRGLLELTEANEAILDDVLVALVGGSAVPDATFLLTAIHPDGFNDPHYFNATPELLVEHHSPKVGLHQFEYIPDPGDLSARVRSLLAPLVTEMPAANGFDASVSADAVARFVESVQGRDVETARSSLIQDGLQAPLVDALIADYTNHPSWVGVVAWNLREETPEGGETVMAIGGDDGCWLLENVPEDSNVVRLRRVSGSVCTDAMLQLLQPLARVYQPSE